MDLDAGLPSPSTVLLRAWYWAQHQMHLERIGISVVFYCQSLLQWIPLNMWAELFASKQMRSIVTISLWKVDGTILYQSLRETLCFVTVFSWIGRDHDSISQCDPSSRSNVSLSIPSEFWSYNEHLKNNTVDYAERVARIHQNHCLYAWRARWRCS